MHCWNRPSSLSALLLLGGVSLRAGLGPWGVSAKEAPEVALLRCDICNLAMTEAAALFEELGINPKAEDDVIDFVDNLCTLSKREGRWLRRLDVRDLPDGRLTVENMTVGFGECRTECLLVRKACQSALGRRQETLVGLLMQQSTVSQLQAKVCRPACFPKKPPAPLRHARQDEEFVRGPDAGMLELLENRDKMRAETGQVVDIMRRDEMESMSDEDREVQAAQDAFAEQVREAREASGRDWRGHDVEM